MEDNVLALHFFFNPKCWHYGFPSFAKDEVNMDGIPTYTVYSMRFLFFGVTLTV